MCHNGRTLAASSTATQENVTANSNYSFYNREKKNFKVLKRVRARAAKGVEKQPKVNNA